MDSKRPGRAIVSVVLMSLLVGTFVAGWIVHGRSRSGGDSVAAPMSVTSQDQAQVAVVRDVFTRAVTTMQSVGSPPRSYEDAAARSVSRGGDAPVLDDEQANHLLEEGQKALRRYFVPELAKRNEVGLRNMIAMSRDPHQINGGAGVSKVTFLDVTVSGATATVRADVTAWAASRVRQTPDGPWLDTHPESTMRFTAELIRSSEGIWLVSALVGNYANGAAG